MPEKVNRRDAIIETAANLFVEQGYVGTSVRQISEAVGCTEAALYYHFKEGKRELMQAVLECNMPDLMNVLEECRDSASLYDLFKCCGTAMLRSGHERMERMRWLIAEFPKMTEDERSLFYNKQRKFHDRLVMMIAPFVGETAEASHMAWLFMAAAFGYGQLFINMNIQSIADMSGEDMVEQIARLLAAGH